MSFGFNKQFKKDDGVTKLKNLQDLKETQLKTRQLENEKKKMEERLQELKLAMEIEKEERLKRAPPGVFWTAGTEGPVINHAQNVLGSREQGIDFSKVKKITVLKDEPIVNGSSKSAAESRPPPGTMAHIASRSAIPHPKVMANSQQNSSSNSSCGQCETQLATMHCRECGENFCRGCFASFHVRGALRSHHPVMISQLPPPPKEDIPPQPRLAFDRPPSGSSNGNAKASSSKRVKFTSESPQQSDRSTGAMFHIERSVVTTIHKGDEEIMSQTTLSYDDQSVSNSFTEEWSAAVNAVASSLVAKASKTASSGSDARSPGRAISSSASGGEKPSTSTCGTSTDAGNVQQAQKDPLATEIQFTSTGISYKDRLLLAKHRRFELPPPNVGVLVPKPPPVPSAGTRRTRLSREGTLTSSTLLSVDANAETIPEPLDFETIEKEILKMGKDGPLIINGRPGSAVAFGTTRWENALDTELDDDEMMLQAFSDAPPSQSKELMASVQLFDDGNFVDDIVDIQDLSEMVESARTPINKTPIVPEGEKKSAAIDDQKASELETTMTKSRPSSSRPLSARKKAAPTPDSLKRMPTKSRAQASSEFGAHHLSTQPSKELKRVITSIAPKIEPSPRPISSAKSSAAKNAAPSANVPSPANVSNFLLMGVENNDPGDSGAKTPRPSSSKSKQNSVNITNSSYSVFKLSSTTWKPFNSVSLGDDEVQLSQSYDDAKKDETTSVQPQVMQLRFPEGQRSVDNINGKSRNGEDDDEDVTPRNSVQGQQAFLGRVAGLTGRKTANDMRVESVTGSATSKSRVPYSLAVPSPRPSSAAQRHGYAQPRTSLQQSIEAWRASSRQEEKEAEEQHAPNSDGDDSDSSEDENEQQGFHGRLANAAPASARSQASGSKSQMMQHPDRRDPASALTPRAHSSAGMNNGTFSARQSTILDDDEDEEQELEQNDEATLRSLTEELQIEVAQSSRDISLIHNEESEVQIPLPTDRTEYDDDHVAVSGNNTERHPGIDENTFLNNDDDDFDDKMALAELATELQITSNQPTVVQFRMSSGTTQPSATGAPGSAGGSGSLANLLHGSARQSQVTTLTSVTSYWSSSPSNSSSFNEKLAPATTAGNLPAVAEDVGPSPALTSRSPQPVVSTRIASGKHTSGMVFNGTSQSKGEFAIRQSSLMVDFDDVEKQLGDNNAEDNDLDEEEEDDEEY